MEGVVLNKNCKSGGYDNFDAFCPFIASKKSKGNRFNTINFFLRLDRSL